MASVRFAQAVAYVIAAIVFAMDASWADIAVVRQAFERGDYDLALRESQRLAEAGNSEAELDLGLLYDTGHGVEQNFAAAAWWYRRASEHGNVTAMFNMGAMYDAGRGVVMDRQEAASWYERAATRGFGRAQYNLGLMLEHGDGVRRNLARAVQLYRLAAANGVTAAGRRLTVVASLATFRAPQPQKNNLTYDEEFARAQAEILERGLSGGDKAAVTALARAAARGSALAAYDLGYCYEVGIGVAANKVQAFVWYTRAEKALLAPGARAAATEAARQIRADLTQAEVDEARTMLQEPRR